MILSAFLTDSKCRWLHPGLADMEKTPNSCIFAYGKYGKYSFFEIFLKIFENHQKDMLKWLNAIYFIRTW